MKSRFTTLLSVVFFFSGFAGLVYQVVWQRMLTIYYGVENISITLIVTVFMLGLGLGALLGGVLADTFKNRLKLYFGVELALGIFGLSSLPLLDFLGTSTSGSSYILSFVYMFLFLCIPTLLMGITLPLLTKIFNQRVQNFSRTVSYLYFINTLGAAVGTVSASYIIISFFGLDTAIYIAAAINFLLAAGIYFLPSASAKTREKEKEPQPEILGPNKNLAPGLAYLLVIVTGFIAIGYEIAGLRVVTVFVKFSPYAFSTGLFVYLLGIALGSFWIKGLLQKRKDMNRKNLFFLLQFFIGISFIGIYSGYYYLTRNIPFFAKLTRISFYTDVHPVLKVPGFDSLGQFLQGVFQMVDIFFWPLVFLFIPALLMGASFPLVSSLAYNRRGKEGKTIGKVYFSNIIGNVLGGIVTGFVLLNYLGTEITLLIFSLVCLSFGLFSTTFLNLALPTRGKVGIILLLILATIIFFPGKHQLYLTVHPAWEYSENDKTYFDEGINGVIMTYQNGEELITCINGDAHGGRPGYSFYYQAIEALCHAKKVENVLIVGFGTGSITEAALKWQDTPRIKVVELNQTLVKNLKKIPVLDNILTSDGVELIIRDGRRFLLGTGEKFDVIMLDPLLTTTAYSNNLYSRQYFEIISQHLNDGGTFMVYMDENKVMPKTVLSVFPSVKKYRFFCVASNSPLKLDLEKRKYLNSRFSADARSVLLRADYSWYEGSEEYIRQTTAKYPINEDWKPVCEYFLGLRFKETFVY